MAAREQPVSEQGQDWRRVPVEQLGSARKLAAFAEQQGEAAKHLVAKRSANFDEFRAIFDEKQG